MDGLLLIESAGDVSVEYWNPATCTDPVVREAVKEALYDEDSPVRECMSEGQVACDPKLLPAALRNVPVAQWGNMEASPLGIAYKYR